MDSALSVHHLKKTYSNGVEALKGASLEIPTGDFFALLGPNGAGKTTIIGIITGLVNKTAGTASIFGYDIDTQPEMARAQIGLVGQEINFNPFEKPIDIVINQGGYYGIPRSIAIPRAKKLLTDLELGDKMQDKAMALSGGMKRRLMIARALIHEPRFLVLDEPTAGVDVQLRHGMWEYLRTLTKGGVTILLTTHYLEEAEQLAKHVAIINKGQIVANGTMDEILAMHDPSTKLGTGGFQGGRLEEVFLKLTKES
ncbi:ABC transporter ATP-binding protein [Candidatus Kaiserbacteria bacterium]|nr:ABC transporter ATP-binding protein [Candidatus Kaiserbacteria bacterium]